MQQISSQKRLKSSQGLDKPVPKGPGLVQEITNYKIQTNHKPQITMYKQRGPSGLLFTPSAIFLPQCDDKHRLSRLPGGRLPVKRRPRLMLVFLPATENRQPVTETPVSLFSPVCRLIYRLIFMIAGGQQSGVSFFST